jgi:dethiobiotin synthetase
MTAICVTAIGTDCGKTHISAALVRELTAQNRPALALKPLMSGYSPSGLETSDAGRLLAAMGRPVTDASVSEICWRRFTEWSAPNVAARKAGENLNYDELLLFVRARMAAHSGATLVEGAGGVMSPLTDTHTNLDLIGDLQLPAILLASNYLGAVSHTLTALDVLDRRGVSIAAVVVTQPLPNAGLAAPLIDELGRWTGHKLVEAGFSRTPEEDRRWAGPLAKLLFG